MSKRILEIGDDEFVRDAFYLKRSDSEFQLNSSGKDDKSTLKTKENYDIIFLDLKKPGMSGAETLQTLHKFDAQSHIYIVTSFYKGFLRELESAAKESKHFEAIKRTLDNNQIVLVAKNNEKTDFV